MAVDLLVRRRWRTSVISDPASELLYGATSPLSTSVWPAHNGRILLDVSESTDVPAVLGPQHRRVLPIVGPADREANWPRAAAHP
jgi:hypothetical protein